MALRAFTQTFVDQFRADRRTSVGDGACPGLVLEAFPPNVRTYIHRFRDEAGRLRRVRIGDARVLKLAEARARVMSLRAQKKADDRFGKSRETAAAQERKRLEASAGAVSPMTYGAFLDRYYIPFIERTHRGVVAEKSYIANHVRAAFGARALADIRKGDIALWVEDLRVRGLRPGSVNRALNILKASLTKAVEWEIGDLSESPARNVKTLKDDACLERFLTPAEAARLIGAVRASENAILFPFVSFLLLTGARKSEALNMRWRDVDFTRCVWTVPLAKSGRARRIPLSPDAIAILRALPHAAQGLAGERDAPVFLNAETGLAFRDLTNSWQTARKRAGLEDVRLHDLRHSYASALVNQGRSIYEVQKLLGHANVRTTERYAHLAPDTLMEGATAVARHFRILPVE